MLERILQSSIRNRILVVVITMVLALVGAHSLSTLPIDAVPDITNNQVQINVVEPAFSVEDMAFVFLGASEFNGDLSSWNTSKVTRMKSMFYEASMFNGDLF